MSQNHPQTNREGVVRGLSALGQTDTAHWVESPNPYAHE